MSRQFRDDTTELLLDDRLAFESLVMSLSTHFINLDLDEFDAGIDYALRRIGEHADVDRAYVFRLSADGLAMNNTHEWTAEGIGPQRPSLQNVPFDSLPWWSDQIRRADIIHIPRVSDLGPDATPERELLQQQGIRSVLALPMTYGRRIVGFVGFDAVRRERRFRQTDASLLRIASEMIATAFERRRAESERRQLETRLAEARNLESVGRLAGGVAHDFNNLLTVILSLGALLRRSATDTRQRGFAAQIVEAAERAAELTNQLLRIGRREVVDSQVVDINEVVRNLMPLLRRTLRADIDVLLDLAPDLAPVRIGLPQVEQILVNLAVNARDAMPEGGRLIIRTGNVTVDEREARRHIDVTPGTYVSLVVSDTGCGMSKEVVSRAFEPFYTTKGEAGTGLGLAIIYGVVKQASGHITLDSEEGRGTTVTVRWPPSDVAAAQRSESPGPQHDAPVDGSETVLLVEDSEDVRRLVAATLREHGYEVLQAESGPEALLLAQRHSAEIDLLLSDVILPAMSGPELAGRLSASRPRLKVLFMSGYADDAVNTAHLLPSRVRLLQKPFRDQDLLRAIRDTLDANSALH